MRNRRFRPILDRLDARISPSDLTALALAPTNLNPGAIAPIIPTSMINPNLTPTYRPCCQPPDSNGSPSASDVIPPNPSVSDSLPTDLSPTTSVPLFTTPTAYA